MKRVNTYNGAGDAENDQVDDGQENLPGRREPDSLVHDQPENGWESITEPTTEESTLLGMN